jgi:hypothetical protein
LENPELAADNSETLAPVILSTGNSSVSGITSIAYNRRKGVGGSMQIEFTGYHPEEPKLSVGTWCFIATSHVAPITDMEAIQKRGLIRFIGQIYELESTYQVDAASGRLMRKVNMVIREWCHVLHCPLRYHPVSQEQNFNKIAIANKLAEDSGEERGKILSTIGSSYSNVFQQPALALAWARCLTENNTSVLQVLGIKAKDLTVFSTTIARLPILPEQMLKDLFPKKRLKPDTAWADKDGFMDLVSGVQIWGSGDKEYFGKKLKADEKANRPVAPTTLDFFMSGESLYQVIVNQVSGGGGVEVFADLWYDGDGKPKPVMVVRDIPFTLKEVDKAIGSSKYPWTYFDDLPIVTIPAERILKISVKQSIHNTANLIQMGIQDGSWSRVAEAQALFYYGTTVLTESQRRFGCQTRPKLSIRDIFSAPQAAVGDEKITTTTTETRGEKSDPVKTQESKAHFQWFAELTRKQIQWYGTDYLFPSCTLVVKDADFPLAAGINVAFSLPNGAIYVGHCEGFSQGFGIDDAGRISSQTTIQLIRLCVLDEDGKYKPMSHRNVVNLLGQPSPVAIDAVYATSGKDEAETFQISANIQVDASAKIIEENYKKFNEKVAEVKKKRAEDLEKAIDAANGKGKRVPQ